MSKTLVNDLIKNFSKSTDINLKSIELTPKEESHLNSMTDALNAFITQKLNKKFNPDEFKKLVISIYLNLQGESTAGGGSSSQKRKIVRFEGRNIQTKTKRNNEDKLFRNRYDFFALLYLFAVIFIIYTAFDSLKGSFETIFGPEISVLDIVGKAHEKGGFRAIISSTTSMIMEAASNRASVIVPQVGEEAIKATTAACMSTVNAFASIFGSSNIQTCIANDLSLQMQVRTLEFQRQLNKMVSSSQSGISVLFWALPSILPPILYFINRFRKSGQNQINTQQLTSEDYSGIIEINDTATATEVDGGKKTRRRKRMYKKYTKRRY